MVDNSNHDYKTPAQGTADWHLPLNENFEAIDADMEVRDKSDNRSDYNPVSGAKFLATDTGVVYLGDDQNWEQRFALPRVGAASLLRNSDSLINGNTANSAATDSGDPVPGATIAGGGLMSADLPDDDLPGDDLPDDDFPVQSDHSEMELGPNEVTAGYGTISGGFNNTVSGHTATISGGSGNETDGSYATVLGGRNNTADGNDAVAAGRNATAAHDGAFVIGDSSDTEIQSEDEDEVRLQGELGFSDTTTQQTAGPIAKGYVNADGTLESGVGVDSVAYSTLADWYQIELPGVSSRSGDHVIHATPVDAAVAVRTTATGEDPYAVEFGDASRHAFQFSVHELP